MNQISVEKKLELIRVIRSQQDKNKELMRNREQLLYGKSFYGAEKTQASINNKLSSEATKPITSGLKIRLTIAFMLVGTVLCLEALQMEEYQKPLNTLYTEIAKEGNIFDFVEDLTYTLKDD